MYAAKWMGVAPWELIEQADEWSEWARLLMHVEQTAQERANRPGRK